MPNLLVLWSDGLSLWTIVIMDFEMLLLAQRGMVVVIILLLLSKGDRSEYWLRVREMRGRSVEI